MSDGKAYEELEKLIDREREQAKQQGAEDKYKGLSWREKLTKLGEEDEGAHNYIVNLAWTCSKCKELKK